MSAANGVGIVGGGLGGLAAACTLAARGHRVILFEKSPWLGGKAAVLQRDGYRFDMGPTILTLPKVLARVFDEAGRKIEDYLDLVRLDPQWRCFFDDGSTLDLEADTERMAGRLDAFAPDSGTGDGYRKFLTFAQRLHNISERFFFWRSVGGLRDMFDFRSMFKPALLGDVLRMRMGQTVARAVRAHVPEARVAQMLDHFTQYVGSAPDASPAVLCGIAHMQTHDGVWYPRGGTGAVPAALARLAGELGVELRTGCGVRRIVLDERGAVAGIETEAGERVPLTAVVSNADAVRTHRELLANDDGILPKAARRFEKRRSYEPACSGVVLYLGLDRSYEHLLHHNFVFSHDPEAEFDAIYHKGEPAPDPTCYVCAPSRTEPGVAPPGGESLYVLVHTPYLRPHHDWHQLFPAYRRTILQKLAKTAGLTDLESRIRVEERLTPQDIHERYRVLNGAIYGLASHGRFFGAFKPANRSRDVPGLYLAGGAAHPGPGMPMVLMSGWIAADTLDRDATARPGRAALTPLSPRGRGAGGEGDSSPLSPRGRGAGGEGEGPEPFAPSPPTPLPSGERGVRVETPLPRGERGESTSNSPVQALLKKRWPWLIRGFTRWVRRYLAKNFHGVRLSRNGPLPDLPAGPLVVVLNHPSWWDPLMGLVLAERLPRHRHFVPIDAEALTKYRFFERLGFFGIRPGTVEGARRFLRLATALLAEPMTALWITAQGKFTDPRQRPLALQAGVGHLVRRLRGGAILPLALEYPFWNERLPEALARFGAPIPIGDGRAATVEEWMRRIEQGLSDAQDALTVESQQRSAALFETLVGGGAGVGGVYDLWRRLRAWLGRRRFQPEHEPTVAESSLAPKAPALPDGRLEGVS